MSPTTLSVATILQTISEQSLGFKFGKPDRPSEKSLTCILPILRETSQQRQYITMPETEKLVVSDSGSISKLNFKNTSKDNIYLRSGTIFEGKGTQSRALTRSAVIFPGGEVGLDVRCIHQSHGIRSGSEFKYGGITPFSVESSNYSAGYRPKDQQSMWDSVRDYSYTVSGMGGGADVFNAQGRSSLRGRITHNAPVRLGGAAVRSVRSVPGSTTTGTSCNAGYPSSVYTSHLGANSDGGFVDATGVYGTYGERGPEMFVGGDDNLKKSFDEFAKNFDDILSKARLHENQAGLALITDTGCKTLEVYDLPSSWEALHKDAVKRMGTELLLGEDKASVFEYKPENAIAAVRKVLALPFKSNLIFQHKPSNGEPLVEIFGLTAGGFVGEVVELDGRVIHLVVLETAQA